MRYEQRKPEFLVSIARPNYSVPGVYVETPILSLDSTSKNTLLTSYSYQQNVESLECPFALSFVPQVVNESGETVADLIRLLDVVRIEEHGEVKYLGVVDSIQYSARMGEEGADREISVTGYGIGGVLNRFSMLLDQVILKDAVTTVEAFQLGLQGLLADLSASHNNNTPMHLIFQAIQDSFKRAMERIGGFTPGTGIFKLVDQYLKFSEDSKTLCTKYPMKLSVFSYGQITLGQAWQDIVFKPFYEFFTRWDSIEKKWLIVLRSTPFDPAVWLKLKKTAIDPLHVQSFDCGYSTGDIKTWFFAYLSGGAMSYELARREPQLTAVKKDSDKWALYGYRPLECNLKYVDRETLMVNGRQVTQTSAKPGDPNLSTETVSDEKLMSEYSDKLYKWFKRADEMLTGSIEMMTMKGGPRIGERVSFADTEFYVQSVSASWRYGSKMTTRLHLTRGGVYNAGHNPLDADDTGNNWWFKRQNRLGNRLELKREV